MVEYIQIRDDRLLEALKESRRISASMSIPMKTEEDLRKSFDYYFIQLFYFPTKIGNVTFHK